MPRTVRIPDEIESRDLAALALEDRERAVQAYARRYGVPEPTARAVVELNAPKRA